MSLLDDNGNPHPCCVPGCGRAAEGYARRMTPDGPARLFACEACMEEADTPDVFHYLLCRVEGASVTMARMLAAARPPMSNTDREFNRGRCNGNQFEGRPQLGDHYQRIARKAGVDPKGKTYLSSLAAFPGDPRAWVDGRGDVSRVCEERGWGCTGAVEAKLNVIAEPTGGGVAQDLIDEKAIPLAENTGMKLEDAQEKVRDVIKPHWVR